MRSTALDANSSEMESGASEKQQTSPTMSNFVENTFQICDGFGALPLVSLMVP